MTGDVDLAHDLVLFINNDGDLYRRQHQPIQKNLATKKARGTYRHELATKLFGYLAESGAKKYARENRMGTWYKAFDVETRRLAAGELTRAFEVAWEAGDYRELLPKKYRAKVAGGYRKGAVVSFEQPTLETSLSGLPQDEEGRLLADERYRGFRFQWGRLGELFVRDATDYAVQVLRPGPPRAQMLAKARRIADAMLGD